jgi:hypothetical protein
MNFEWADFSDLSFEALDDLLLRSAVILESEDSLLRDIQNLGSGYRILVRHIQLGFLSSEGISILADHIEIPAESLWELAVEIIAHPSPPELDSLIISAIPEIFADLGGQNFKLLWRGSRDGFGVSDFHRCCDGHANTLTVVLDTGGTIFGGFTPIEWDSRVWNGQNGRQNNCYKTDDSEQSFVFTLKNPHNIPARRFLLKTKAKWQAIGCLSVCGPYFPGGFQILQNCNAQANSRACYFGSVYINDTGVGGLSPHSTFLTGSEHFQVKEIEVLEITD